METNYAKSAYRTFLFWGVCSSLGVTVSTLVDATLVGNFIGSTGLAVANIATPVFLLYLLMGITLGGGAGVLIGKKLGEADLKGANRIFGSVLSAGLITGVLFAAVSLVFRSALCSLLGATPELLPQALQYLTVVFAFAPIYVLYNILSIAERAMNLKYFESLIPLLKAYNVGVCVENLYEAVGGRITEGTCADPQDAIYYVDTLNHLADEELFGCCLDTGHMELTHRDPADYIRQVGKRLKILHIHENDAIGDLHQMLYTFGSKPEDGVDWNDFRKALNEIGFDGTLSFETFPCVNSFPRGARGEVLRTIREIGKEIADKQNCEE